MWPILSWFVSIYDSWTGNYPYIPEKWGDQENLDDESIHYIHWFKELLLKLAPQLLDQLNRAVIPAAREVKKIENDIASLEAEKAELLPEIADAKNRIKRNSQKMPKIHGKSSLNLLFPIGLSLMLMLGISEIIGIDIQSLTPDQYPLFALALCGAIFINIAESDSITRHVQYIHASKQGQPKIPFWNLLKEGHPPFYLAILIILLEISFATPGLINLLPPSVSRNPVWQMVVFFGAGLAALVNVTQAWGAALPKLEDEEKKLQIMDKIDQENHAINAKVVMVKHLESQIQEKKQILSDRTARAIKEHRRWELSVKHCMRCHSKTVEEFYEQYRQGQSYTGYANQYMNNIEQQNGHSQKPGVRNRVS
jgi:hypothetical protein